MNVGADTGSLVLFDIDGTLMITKGATSRAILRACRAIHGERVEWGGVTVGTLDPQIYAQLSAHNGIESPMDAWEAYRERYLTELTEELDRVAADITVLPGVEHLLQTLRGRDDVTLGLLSGNLREAAMLKITAAGFDPEWFAVTAFAEDGSTRDELPHVALERWAGLLGRSADAARVIVVGDTPRDVQCARACGCRVVSVATGHYDAATLQRCDPDVVVEDLRDCSALLLLLEQLDNRGIR